MLAAGSSDGCAVVFPTDERYLKDMWARNNFNTENNIDVSEESYLVGESTATVAGGLDSARSSSGRKNAGGNLFARQAADIPIVKNGTPLVRGHEKEVGALTWTSDGRLVTVGDDYLVRCWSEEDRGRATDLRTGGEAEGRRWWCGWADVGDNWVGDGDDW